MKGTDMGTVLTPDELAQQQKYFDRMTGGNYFANSHHYAQLRNTIYSVIEEDKNGPDQYNRQLDVHKEIYLEEAAAQRRSDNVRPRRAREAFTQFVWGTVLKALGPIIVFLLMGFLAIYFGSSVIPTQVAVISMGSLIALVCLVVLVLTIQFNKWINHVLLYQLDSDEFVSDGELELYRVRQRVDDQEEVSRLNKNAHHARKIESVLDLPLGPYQVSTQDQLRLIQRSALNEQSTERDIPEPPQNIRARSWKQLETIRYEYAMSDKLYEAISNMEGFFKVLDDTIVKARSHHHRPM